MIMAETFSIRAASAARLENDVDHVPRELSRKGELRRPPAVNVWHELNPNEEFQNKNMDVDDGAISPDADRRKRNAAVRNEVVRSNNDNNSGDRHGMWFGRSDVPKWMAKNEETWSQGVAFVRKSEELRQECRRREKIAGAVASRNQEESTRTLSERCRDLESFRILLRREWDDMREELQLLRHEKRRLEKAMLEFDAPIWLASECLIYRTCRPGRENTADFPEILLQQEKRLGERIQATLKTLIAAVDEQLERNTAAKTDVEADWSRKLKANDVDRRSTSMPASASFPGLDPTTAVCLPESMSTPEEWLKRSQEILDASAETRRQSRNLRLACADVRERASKDVCTAKADVDDALEARIDELEAAKIATAAELYQVLDESDLARESQVSCQDAERAQVPFLGLATTRLARSRSRPCYELCRDPPRARLREEVEDCCENVTEMRDLADLTTRRLEDMENSAMQLTKLNVDHELALDIDRRLCRPTRSAYPGSVALAGYQ